MEMTAYETEKPLPLRFHYLRLKKQQFAYKKYKDMFPG